MERLAGAVLVRTIVKMIQIMPILNYTTSIAALKTTSEVQRILVSHGVKSINIDFNDEGNPVALTFAIMINDQFVNFRLPSNWQGVNRRLLQDGNVPKRFKNDEQALRVAWRILKDWVEAQMAVIEAGFAELPEVFLPYAVRSDGQTMYQALKDNQRLLDA